MGEVKNGAGRAAEHLGRIIPLVECELTGRLPSLLDPVEGIRIAYAQHNFWCPAGGPDGIGYCEATVQVAEPELTAPIGA